MIRTPLLLLLALAACAAAPAEEWPSLALRPGEAQTLVARPAAGRGGAPAAPATAAAPALADAGSRLATLDRDAAAFEKRLRAQITATAGVAERGGTDAAATAELEATRLDRLAAQASDLRDRYDALAGDLARQAAGGGDVTGLLTETGRGIERLEVLRADQARAYAAARGAARP